MKNSTALCLNPLNLVWKKERFRSILIMVLISDGQIIKKCCARMKAKKVFSYKNIRLATAFELTKCLKQIN